MAKSRQKKARAEKKSAFRLNDRALAGEEKRGDLPGEWRWRDGRAVCFMLRGLGWPEENDGYARLPQRAEKMVRDPVWLLGQCPSGASIDFQSDATAVAIRVELVEDSAKRHWALSGVSGVTLYADSGSGMLYCGSAMPNPGELFYQSQISTFSVGSLRQFRLYLPLYTRVRKIEIGLPPAAKIRQPAAMALTKPVVVYGTSITQGACASTPAGTWVSMAGRALNLEMIDLGFAGNGWGEPEIARLLAELDPAAYILDYAANVDWKGMRKTLPEFYRILRRARPETTIIIQTQTPYGGDRFLTPGMLPGYEIKRDVMMEFYLKQRKAGDAKLHLIDGSALLPFGEGGMLVDGVHPTDLGFGMIAQRLVPQLRRLLLPA